MNEMAATSFVGDNRDRFLSEYRAFLGIPSISTLSEHAGDVQRAAEWLAARLRRCGMDKVELLPTGGAPVVYAEWLNASDKPTLLVYGHYDVQPVDPIAEWTSNPFAAEIRGDYIFARGASDMKGQIAALLYALEAIAAQGPFPVNLRFLLEGEEEIGSPHLAAFIETHRDGLACDVVLNCDAGIHAPDQPSIVYA
ncbi:MAG TPA: M20/M25/M40 family metallo-hydrolase, partial [Candidatus Hydrogenedentes bacterium]|nr:M20/M25/M40 family metallo-hydrolase [Candidatus Hydrogenedentota bacterium]